MSSRGPLPTAPVEPLIEWPADPEAPAAYWFVDLRGEHLGLRRFVRLAKGRWHLEQDYRERQDELGLDHFEGRSWPGWHHHVTLASMAYAFLVLEGLRRQETPCATLPTIRRQLHVLLIRWGARCPTCRRPWDDSSSLDLAE